MNFKPASSFVRQMAGLGSLRQAHTSVSGEQYLCH